MKLSDIRRDNLRRLIEEAGSAVKLAELAGTSPSYLSQVLTKRVNPGSKKPRSLGDEVASRIEAAMGKPKGWMNSAHWESVNENLSGYAVTKKMVPLISWVNAGDFCEAIDNLEPGDAMDWLPCPRNVGPHTFALRVQGDSMTSPHPGQRSYPEGSIIYVDPDREVTNGCRVVAKLVDTQEVTFKRYVEDAGSCWLMPINPQYPSLKLEPGAHICGVVVGVYWEE